MAAESSCPAEAILPLLLSLPAGVVGGVATVHSADRPTEDLRFACFASLVRREADLRHAIARPPGRLVLDAGSLSSPLVAAALPALSRVGTVVVVVSADPAALLCWCDRILVATPRGARWVDPDFLRAGRRLELLVERRGGSPARVAVPLPARGGAEAVLSSARARGHRVLESRVVYRCPGALTPRAAPF